MISFINRALLIKTGLLFLFFSAGFIRAYFALMQTSYGNGWDAYYYLIQIRSLIEEGRMHSPDYSLVYVLLLFVKLFTSDYLTALKLASAVTAGMYTSALFYAGTRIASDKKIIVGALAASVGLFSPAAIFVDVQFIKQLLGIVFLIFLISTLSRSKWYVILPLFVATLITHRLTGVLALIFLILHFASIRNWKLLLAFLALPLIISLFIPGVLNVMDISRFTDEFRSMPQFAPLSFLDFYGHEKMHPFWESEVILAIVFWFLWIIKEIKTYRREPFRRLKLALWLCGTILLFPFFTFKADGLAVRLFLTFLIITPLLIVFLAPRRSKVVLLILSLVFVVFSVFSYKAYNPLNFDPPYHVYKGVTEKTFEKIDRNNTKLVIVHKALAEYFTFETSIDAMPWKADTNENISEIMRISCTIENNEFENCLDSVQMLDLTRVGVHYFLLHESTWDSFCSCALQEKDSILIAKLRSWENPWRIRPAFIRANRRK